jgi:hypothetical protein
MRGVAGMPAQAVDATKECKQDKQYSHFLISFGTVFTVLSISGSK